jgi:hypothetical protein
LNTQVKRPCAGAAAKDEGKGALINCSIVKAGVWAADAAPCQDTATAKRAVPKTLFVKRNDLSIRIVILVFKAQFQQATGGKVFMVEVLFDSYCIPSNIDFLSLDRLQGHPESEVGEDIALRSRLSRLSRLRHNNPDSTIVA